MSVKLKGRLGYRLLATLTRRFGALDYDYEHNDPTTTSRLRRYFGTSLESRLADKVVLDIGCGRGADVVAAALAGAQRVIGIDLNEAYLESARRLAGERGVAERCSFINAKEGDSSYRSLGGSCDVIISVDAFEHFGDPAAVLREMHALLKPGGSVLTSFGPPWKHPYGAHMNHFNRLPWLHFFFAEATILAVRKNYLDDGATRFEEVTGGLNRMTVERFERLAAQAGFAFAEFEPVPIRGLHWLTKNRFTREYFTSYVRADLRKTSDLPKREKA